MRMLKGLALGAILMYVFDPNQGRRRRARLRDTINAFGRDVLEGIGIGGRDLRNRAIGAVGRARQLTEPQPPDTIVEERVRARLGHFVRNSGVLDVSVQDGVVTLRGQILATNVDALTRKLTRVAGVRRLENALEILPDAAGVEGEDVRRRIARVDLAPLDGDSHWTPSKRLLIGSGGGLLLVRALGSHGIARLGLSTLGMVILSRVLVARAGGEPEPEMDPLRAERASTVH